MAATQPTPSPSSAAGDDDGTTILTFDVNPGTPTALAPLTAAASPPPLHPAPASLTLPCGGAYEGDALDGVPHGDGVLTQANGDTYRGSWRGGVQCGRGVASFVRGEAYDGEWQGGVPHGHGRATYANGGFYVGDFAAGVRAGWGRHAFPAGGGWYEGEWETDAPHGAGVWVDADGGKFVGTFAGGARVKGVWTAASGGAFYDGEWGDDGAPRGAGVGSLPAGPPGRYTGAWSSGAPHGRGVAHYVDGAVYDGTWADGAPHGAGALTRPDGSFYRGAWVRGREHGRGRALLPSGARYEGDWVDGVPHGVGKERTVDGETYEGGFERGARAGRGRAVAADGSSYVGAWAAGARHGRGTAVFADGTVFDGRWEGGAWVQSAADAARCVVEGAIAARGGAATAGTAATLTIHARDDDGQPRLSGGDAFTVWAVQADGSRVDGGVADRGDGRYGVTLTPTRAGAARLFITAAAAAAVADSPYDFYVAAGPVDPQSTLVDWPPPRVDGRATCRLRVGARDACGNTLPPAAALAAVTATMAVGGALVPLLFEAEASADGNPTGWVTAPLALPPPPAAAVLDVRVAGRRAPGAPRSLLVRDDGSSVDAAPPPRDAVSEWGRVADALSASDGDDKESDLTEEDKAAAAGVPVVEDLADLWLVSKLQRERGVVE